MLQCDVAIFCKKKTKGSAVKWSKVLQKRKVKFMKSNCGKYQNTNTKIGEK